MNRYAICYRPLRCLAALNLAALLIGVTVPAAHGQGFTYQGRLDSTDAPFTGTVHVRLSLHTTVSGGILALKSETIPGVVVSGGLFTVNFSTATAADFNGAARYLEIEISDNGGSSYTMLTPRQLVTWVPYSLHAKVAESVTGTVPASQISGTLNPSLIGSGTATGTVTFNPASGAPFAVGTTTKVTNLNSDLLDGLDATAFLRSTGGTLTGTLNVSPPGVLDFGSGVRQMINLWGGTQFGLGVQTGTLYQRSNTRFSWFTGGTHSDLEDNPGTGGTDLMTLSDSFLLLRPRRPNTIAAQGPIKMGFGDLTPAGQPYVSVGESDADDEMELVAKRINIRTENTTVPTSIHFGTTTGQHLVLYQNATDTYGVGVQGSTEYFRTGDQFAWFKDGVHTDSAADPGTGGTLLATLNNQGNFTAQFLQAEQNVIAGGTIITGQGGYFGGNVTVNGTTSTKVLTITGGADVAEPFQMSDSQDLEPGSVVVIDEANPGKLKQSSSAYDKRVAGIISGAGGVQPGLTLQQDGVLEGGRHVALSGRVYVKADNSAGAIEPGDMLTTSDNPGRAMKAAEHSKAQGAIIGKAMSRLDESTGMVLVLVTLQ